MVREEYSANRATPCLLLPQFYEVIERDLPFEVPGSTVRCLTLVEQVVEVTVVRVRYPRFVVMLLTNTALLVGFDKRG